MVQVATGAVPAELAGAMKSAAQAARSAADSVGGAAQPATSINGAAATNGATPANGASGAGPSGTAVAPSTPLDPLVPDACHVLILFAEIFDLFRACAVALVLSSDSSPACTHSCTAFLRCIRPVHCDVTQRLCPALSNGGEV